MKKITCLLLLLVSFSLFSHAQDKFYVSPKGNDQYPGTKTQPFRTLTTALSKVANAKAKTVSIYLRKGKYNISKTIVLDSQLLNRHHLIIKPYNQEQVILSGSTILHPKWAPYNEHILQSQVGKGLKADMLLCNGTPLIMARYPNYTSSARVFNGTTEDAISKERVKKWANPSGGFVHALHAGEWGGFHYRITGKNEKDSLLLEGGWQNNRPSAMNKKYRFVENVFEELDAPGEWYYNTETGMMYLYPPKEIDLHTAIFECSALDNIIVFKGTEKYPVKDVTISGIQFTGTNRTFMYTKEPLLKTDWCIYRGGAVLIEGAENISIRNCTFSYLGGNAVFVSKYNRNISVLHNHIHNIGGNAIAFVGDSSAVRSATFRYGLSVPIDKMDLLPGPKNNQYPAQCIAHDNLIHHIGTVEKQVAGIEIDMAMDITASHNTIYNVPRAGINIGDGCWGGHIIAYNDVFKTVLETGDHGAFNSWGRDRYWLPGIKDVDNLVAKYPDLPFLDVIKPIILHNNRFQCEHGWDIDLDDGSSNYQISNNVCLNGGLKLREGYKRVVKNNILLNNTFHPHVWYTNSGDVFTRNIVTNKYAPIQVKTWGHMVDSNFFIRKAALAFAQGNKTDIHSIYGNPGFINAGTGNFSVHDTSKALQTGFKNFSMTDFGVVSPQLKRVAEKPIIKSIEIFDNTQQGKTYEWQGAAIKNIETLGEQSASGALSREGVLIVKVAVGSIAEKNQLTPGNILIKLDNQVIKNVSDFLGLLQEVKWKGKVPATILHNQQLKNIDFWLH